jgi:two-component system, sensor histidine kinase YesM
MIRMSSIFTILFLSFIIVIIPVYLISIFIFSWSKNVVEEGIKQSTYSHVEHIKESMEIEIERINDLQNELINDIEIMKFISNYNDMPNYEYYTSINKIKSILLFVKNSNIFIDDVMVHIPKANITISSIKGLIKSDIKQISELINMYEKYPGPVIIDDSSIHTVTLFPVRRDYSDKPPYLLVQIYIDRKMLLNFLNQFGTRNKGEIMLYHYNNDYCLYNYEDSIINSTSSAVWNKDNMKTVKEHIKNKIGIDIIKEPEEEYLLITNFSDYLNVSLAAVVSLRDIFKVSAQFNNYMLLFVSTALVIILIYTLLTFKTVMHPVNAIMKAFKNLEEGKLDIRINEKAAFEFNKLFHGFNLMVKRLNNSIDRVYRQELYAKRAQLKQLQTQINPHFIYNTYFILNRMILDNDLKNASLLSEYLGEYLKYITRNAQDTVPLEMEIKHMQNYTAIQVIRFSGRLNIQMETFPEKFKEYKVPRLILQPIIENAVEYGIKRSNKNYRTIKIDYKTENKKLIIDIEDNNEEIKNEKIEELQRKLSSTTDDMEVTGIINIHRRLGIMFGDDSGISIKRSPLGGLSVEIKIDFSKRVV